MLNLDLDLDLEGMKPKVLARELLVGLCKVQCLFKTLHQRMLNLDLDLDLDFHVRTFP